MPPTPPPEPQLVMLPGTKPPVSPPSMRDLAAFVGTQAEDLRDLCHRLKGAFEACAQDIDPGLDEQEMFDPIAARFLWHHVPDLQDIACRLSILGFWLAILRAVLDIERERGAVR